MINAVIIDMMGVDRSIFLLSILVLLKLLLLGCISNILKNFFNKSLSK